MLLVTSVYFNKRNTLSKYGTFVLGHPVYLGGMGKMAVDVTRSIEEALNEIVDTTDQGGNMRKELKRAIYEHVRTLRNLFVEMQAQWRLH